VSLVMQRAGRYFVRDINRVYRRGGTLWKGRFKADINGTILSDAWARA
jgi:hypothetical protein